MQVQLFIPPEDIAVSPHNSFVAAWRVTERERIHALPGQREAWKLQCDEHIEIPDADPLAIYHLNDVESVHILDRYVLLWQDRVWRTNDENVLQWLVTGRNRIGFIGNSNLDAGYFYCPYLPLQLTPVVLDHHGYTPTKGILTRYGKRLLQEGYVKFPARKLLSHFPVRFPGLEPVMEQVEIKLYFGERWERLMLKLPALYAAADPQELEPGHKFFGAATHQIVLAGPSFAAATRSLAVPGQGVALWFTTGRGSNKVLGHNAREHCWFDGVLYRRVTPGEVNALHPVADNGGEGGGDGKELRTRAHNRTAGLSRHQNRRLVLYLKRSEVLNDPAHINEVERGVGMLMKMIMG